MRTYLIVLGEISSYESDEKFAKYVNENNFEFWRYTIYNWILLTPDNIYTNTLIHEVMNAYGPVFNLVLEIDIKDFGGLLAYKEINDIDPKDPILQAPFQWFRIIKDPSFVPRWENDKRKV